MFTMKKSLLFIGLCIFTIILQGCANQKGLGDETDTLHGTTPDNMNTRITEEKEDTQYGYVRYNENQLDMEREKNFAPKIDREKMANMITKTLLTLDDIEEAATLVTDSHTLVAYTPADGVERERAAEDVKKTTLSFLPRWYHVYISDQSTAYTDLQSLSNNTTTETGTILAIESVIERFTEQSPQGGEYSEEDHRMNYRD
ncbi:hypothetical protein HNQ94_001896 [Salirhabdus euzebyi]|uniref:Sporulation lipoprotein YhcN/YlaJ (Spore_YhcN_YlaJ) n=1 Tax=Salirhabdus euzebyi TaxID=394506 RepID=A0A841Q501_9BACI|nr:YhcN/YlaJ family sporulation lipoprotein [Salirhabdus euzebyi]MBB6453447.1 hypothetical protein [Salirhabdus euzebyi]